MSMYMRRSKQPSGQVNQQAGFVSIIVTMIIMVLLSLIVLGFAKVSRRESRQGLDRQLASQARYAAESGINDAQAYLRGGGALSSTASTTCNTYAVLPDGHSGVPRDATIADDVSVSCVLVDGTVTDLQYDNVGTDEQVVVPIKSVGGNIQSLFIAWSGGVGDYTPTNCPATTPSKALLPVDDWKCPAGALRVDIVPGGNFFSDGRNVTGVLLFPKVGNGVSNGEGISNGKHIWAECPNASPSPRACRVSLLNLPANATYYLRIRPIYKQASIYVRASNRTDMTGDPNTGSQGLPALGLQGAQVMIDSTGRAGDVLKRLVARVPACKAGEACGKQPAGYAIQSADTLCKLYAVIPPSKVIEGNTSDPSCILPN